MASNYSDKAKTLKEMFNLIPSDFWTIDRVQLYCDYADMSQIIETTILDEYREYFEQFLEEVEVDPKFYYSPAAFAEFYYGTPGLDFLVMYFANIISLYDFNKPKIKVLSLGKLKDLNQLIVYKKNLVDKSKLEPRPYHIFNEISDVKTIIREAYNKPTER